MIQIECQIDKVRDTSDYVANREDGPKIQSAEFTLTTVGATKDGRTLRELLATSGRRVRIIIEEEADASPDCRRWPRDTYRMTQEKSASVSAPKCSGCGLLADIVSDAAFAEYGVRAVACSECGVGGIEDDGLWVDRIPMVLTNYFARLRAKAKDVAERRQAARGRPEVPPGDTIRMTSSHAISENRSLSPNARIGVNAAGDVMVSGSGNADTMVMGSDSGTVATKPFFPRQARRDGLKLLISDHWYFGCDCIYMGLGGGQIAGHRPDCEHYEKPADPPAAPSGAAATGIAIARTAPTGCKPVPPGGAEMVAEGRIAGLTPGPAVEPEGSWRDRPPLC